ncbi:UDP-3-O-acyl-N-acetylglucosamine deacetylase-like isoform X3 [Asparagus officinalis]|uniref:UDP-3-O-acyl-N-acetylglucosamine deacetylase-like isoform X3 n=1 Tax=Asparagus officinalis TaxID=4686 RepID=UPI00098E13C1|nr:UDP-3-O-acyl-N-acetylglucosamine deacetylase-like isoform X3 [Asparagus officinalis]
MDHRFSSTSSSFFGDLTIRELNGFRVRKRPYLGDLSSESGVVLIEHDGITTPPLAVSFSKAPAIGCQWYSCFMDDAIYSKEIAPSRTFCIYEEVEMMRKAGLIQGGSLENAMVCSATTSWLNPPLHFDDEPCRHKLLDLVGDFSLFAQNGNQGLPLAHIIAYKVSIFRHHAMFLSLTMIYDGLHIQSFHGFTTRICFILSFHQYFLSHSTTNLIVLINNLNNSNLYNGKSKTGKAHFTVSFPPFIFWNLPQNK